MLTRRPAPRRGLADHRPSNNWKPAKDPYRRTSTPRPRRRKDPAQRTSPPQDQPCGNSFRQVRRGRVVAGRSRAKAEQCTTKAHPRSGDRSYRAIGGTVHRSGGPALDRPGCDGGGGFGDDVGHRAVGAEAVVDSVFNGGVLRGQLGKHSRRTHGRSAGGKDTENARRPRESGSVGGVRAGAGRSDTRPHILHGPAMDRQPRIDVTAGIGHTAPGRASLGTRSPAERAQAVAPGSCTNGDCCYRAVFVSVECSEGSFRTCGIRLDENPMSDKQAYLKRAVTYQTTGRRGTGGPQVRRIRGQSPAIRSARATRPMRRSFAGVTPCPDGAPGRSAFEVGSRLLVSTGPRWVHHRPYESVIGSGWSRRASAGRGWTA
jgi:hypothetical protein